MFRQSENHPEIPKASASVKKGSITTFNIAMMTCAAVLSLRGLPVIAKEELAMFFYILFSTLLFLLPVSLVSAELGSALGHKRGGVYAWVSEAFNKKTGFMAIWLEWAQSIVLYPTVLGFASGAFAYAIGRTDLASNGIFVGCFSVFTYWACTFITLQGSGFIKNVISYGFLLGTIIPGLLIIALAILWASKGHTLEFLVTVPKNAEPSHIDGTILGRIIPHFDGIKDIAFLAGILLLFSGVEVQAVHANALPNPQQDFPKAMLIAAALIFTMFTLGALSVGAIISTQHLNVQSGLMQAYQKASEQFNANFLTNIAGALVFFGAFASVMSWMSGPSKGLLVTAKDGLLPKFMSKTNANGIQSNILFLQGAIVTVLASLYIFLEDVNVAFFLLTVLTLGLYLIMYMLMYISAIKLKFTQPNLPRPFKVPGGNFGMIAIAGIGLLAVIFSFILAFVPPARLTIGSPSMYVALVATGTIVLGGMPFLIFFLNKSKPENSLNKE